MPNNISVENCLLKSNISFQPLGNFQNYSFVKNVLTRSVIQDNVLKLSALCVTDSYACYFIGLHEP